MNRKREETKKIRIMSKCGWPTWKKVLFCLVVLAVFVRILYIVGRGELNEKSVTSTEYDFTEFTMLDCRNVEVDFIGGKDKLESLELFFANIVDGGENDITLTIEREGRKLYQTHIFLEEEENWQWKKLYVNLTPEKGAEYTISLQGNDAGEQIPALLVMQHGAQEILRSCQDGKEINGTIAINFDYRISPGYFDRMIAVSLWILFTTAVFLFLFYFEKITGIAVGIYERLAAAVSPAVLTAVLEILAAVIIVNSSGIEFQEPTKVILYGISLLAVVKREDKAKYVRELADRPFKRVFLYLLYGYAAFALVGQRIWIYPLDIKINMAGLFVSFVTVYWFVPVIDSLLYGLEMAGRFVSGERRLKTWQFSLLCTVLLLLPAGYNLLANNPGISSPDTVSSMVGNAQHLHGMYDWHPFFYCLVLRMIQEISNTTYAVIAVQYFFWFYVMNELLCWLRKRGIRENVLIGLACFSGFNAANLLHLNTIWKDVPYTLSLLWMFVILAKLSLNDEKYRGKWYIYLEFVVAMTGLCLYRKNGMVSFVLIIAVALVVLRKNGKVWLASAAAIALVFVIKGPVYDYFEVVDSGQSGIYIGLGQDVLGAYYSGGEVSEDTLAMVTSMTAGNNNGYSYWPTWSYAAYEVDVTPPGFITRYMDTFVKNPILMLRAVIDREDALWDIFMGKDSMLGCVNYTGTSDEDTEWTAYYPERHYVSLYTDMAVATDYTAKTQWIAAIEWRCGLFLLLGLTAFLFILFKRGQGKYLVVLAPMVGHILSLLLSTGWSDFRYFWPVNLLNTVWIMIVLMVAGQDGGAEKERTE